MADVEAQTQGAPAQFKQRSRKGKKAWRKNVDVTDVQSGLDDIRGEIIEGGILAERPAEELFATDLTGEESVQKDYGRKHKPLRSEQIIAQRSAVPAVDSRKRKSDGIATGSSKRSKNGVYVPHSELERLKALAYSTSSAKPVPTPISAAYDPWAVVSVVEDPTYSFIDKAQPAKEPQTLKHPPISLASSGKPFAAVKKPEAGKSYNPAFEDWDALVTREGIKEVEAERKRVEDAEKEEARLAKAIAEAAIPEPNPEDDDYMSAWESEWEGIQSEAEDSHLDKKRPERKSQSERNKIKKRKEAEAKALWEKQMKKRQDQENRIKEISRAVAKKERQRQLAAIVPHVDSSEDEEVLRRRKLGRNPVPEAPLELVLADELQDSLRALRPEGNLLKDRFRNLLLNGKIETRRPINQPKKPKRVATEKWSYKDWKLR